MTIRSHDQFNTTVYGDDDRYRGVKGDRRIVFLHEDDLRDRGLADGEPIDVTSWFEGETRTLRSFKARAYDIPRGCAAAYFPEANALVPVRAFAHGSNTPAYKSIVVTIAKASPLSE
jgi:anaerobic selenocysteine-containing dehydrogenase